MERLDQVAVDSGLEIRQMMELAGWHMVRLFERLEVEAGASVAIVCGVGNKGGDGLAAARQLVNYGWDVQIILVERLVSEDAQHQLKIAQDMKIPVMQFDAAGIGFGQKDVVIDSLIGYHLDGPPRGLMAEAIKAINDAKALVVAYDLPSGLDPTTGACLQPCVRADSTLALALPKKAFLTEPGRQVSGRVFLADIGIPAWMYDRINKGSRPPFSSGLLELSRDRPIK